MKTKKKILVALALVGCAILLVAGSIAGTMAYLTSTTETVENTFTVGNVSITLDETKVDAYGVVIENEDPVVKNEYKLIPGHTYTKDPTIHVDADSEECWLFVKVVNGISDIEVAADATNAANESETIAEQMAAKGWTAVAGAANVYAYSVKVAAGSNIVVFDAFTIAGNADLDGDPDYSNATITVTAYAIQADGFNTAAEAWAAAPASFAN